MWASLQIVPSEFSNLMALIHIHNKDTIFLNNIDYDASLK